MHLRKLIFLINNYIFQISYIVFVTENSDTFPSPIANQIIYISTHSYIELTLKSPLREYIAISYNILQNWNS